MTDTEFAGVTLPALRMSREGWRRPGLRKDDGIIDEVAIDRALCYEDIPLTTREVIAAIARGAEIGYTDTEIGERLGMSIRHVGRLRARYHIATGYVPDLLWREAS